MFHPIQAFNIISIDAFVSNELNIPFVLNTKNLLKVRNFKGEYELDLAIN